MRRRLIWVLPIATIFIPVVAFAAAFLTVSPSKVSFPTQCAFSAAQPHTVTVTNNGDVAATSVNVAVSPSSMSSIFPIGGQTANQQLTPGENLQFQVGFDPVHVGTSAASAVVTYTSPEPTPTDTNHPGPGPKPTPTSTPTPSTTVIPLSGKAIDRFVDVAPLGVNFGSSHVGKPAHEKTITIFDDGASPLSVDGITIGGRHSGDFTVKDFAPTTITDGDPLKVTLVFKPRAAGARAAELEVHSDSCEQPSFQVQLAGIGTEPDVKVQPDPIDFRDHLVGTQTKKRILITNQGGWPLRLKDVTFQSADPTTTDLASFTVITKPTLPKTLQPAKSVIYELTFAPTEPGPRKLKMTVKSNDPDHPLLRAAIVANGTVPPTPTVTASASVAPPKSGGGFHLHLGPYIPTVAVTAAIVAFFYLLVVVRRRRGIPE